MTVQNLTLKEVKATNKKISTNHS